MLWTCSRCDYDRVSWTPKTWSEAQIGAVARARCEGRETGLLRGARGFVFLGNRYAVDAPVRCPKCRQKFFPGDSLEKRVTPRRDTPTARDLPSLPGAM